MSVFVCFEIRFSPGWSQTYSREGSVPLLSPRHPILPFCSAVTEILGLAHTGLVAQVLHSWQLPSGRLLSASLFAVPSPHDDGAHTCTVIFADHSFLERRAGWDCWDGQGRLFNTRPRCLLCGECPVLAVLLTIVWFILGAIVQISLPEISPNARRGQKPGHNPGLVHYAKFPWV